MKHTEEFFNIKSEDYVKFNAASPLRKQTRGNGTEIYSSLANSMTESKDRKEEDVQVPNLYNQRFN